MHVYISPNNEEKNGNGKIKVAIVPSRNLKIKPDNPVAIQQRYLCQPRRSAFGHNLI